GGITRSGINGEYAYKAIQGKENHPVTWVNFWDAASFANWLTSGNTNKGIYDLDSTGKSNNSITRNATEWSNGAVAIASHDEWYKAAYYSGSSTGADGDAYWLYPTQSNSIMSADANYGDRDGDGGLLSVGTYSGKSSYYGTFDQAGNAREWTESIPSNKTTQRLVLGGQFDSKQKHLKKETYSAPNRSFLRTGFRVTTLVPNFAPSWIATKWSLKDANVGEEYSLSLTEYAFDPDGDTLVFTKLIGPDWLSLDSNGNLVGKPSDADVGINYAYFRVTDPSGLYHDHSAPVDIKVLHPSPSIPNLISTSDTGISESDDLCNDTTPSFNGTTNAGFRIELFSDDVSLGSTTADGSGNWSLTVADSSALTDGYHLITAISSDSAGNTSAVSDHLRITVDATVPIFTSGESASIINENSGPGQLIYSATTEDASSLTYNFRANNNDDAAAFSLNTTSGEVRLSADPDYEQQSAYRFTLVARDAAGNSNERQVSLAINDLDETPPDQQIPDQDPDEPVDNTPPASPSSPDLIAFADSGISTIDNLTNDNTPSFIGTAEAGSRVELFVGVLSVGTTTADAMGSWSFTVDDSSGFSDGPHSITATATDGAGNSSAPSAALNILVDTTAAVDLEENIIDRPGNEAPSDLRLSSTSFDENINDGSLIGLLTSTDPDADDSHRYEFATGRGDNDNNAFRINDDQLEIKKSPDYETKSDY
ncbi:MAG: Ig-like domain-containing protein, partial [Prochlorococcus sp.]